MGKALRCSWDVPTDQHLTCRVLPLPVVLFPEMPLRGRGGDKDGGMQLLPDNAVVWTSWPGTPSLFGCLKTRHWLPPEKVSGQLLDTRGHCAFQGGFPPPWLLWAQRRGFCSASPGILLWAGPTPRGGWKLHSGIWAYLASKAYGQSTGLGVRRPRFKVWLSPTV